MTKKENEKRNALINQLQGNHFYISDHIVDTNELKALVKLIESSVYNSTYTPPHIHTSNEQFNTKQ